MDLSLLTPAARLRSLTQRWQILQRLVPDSEMWVIAEAATIAWATGFEFLVPNEREALLFVSQAQSYLIHTSFVSTDVTTTATALGLRLLPNCHAYVQHAQHIFQSNSGLRSLKLNQGSLSLAEGQALIKTWQESGHEPLQLDKVGLELGTLMKLRLHKDEYELEASREAGRLAAASLAAALPRLKAGITEQAFKAHIEFELTARGSTKPAFPTIVAFGDHATAPHHQPGDTPLQENQVVLIDMGAVYDDHHSDMTRTIWFGPQPTASFKTIEKTVKAAYQTAVDQLNTTLKQGAGPITASQLDDTARQLITDAGYGKYFIHTLGHGVGYEIHEAPSLSRHDPTPLTPGLTITIEPGIYWPGQPDDPAIGYRYENTFAITTQGAENLTATPTLP